MLTAAITWATLFAIAAAGQGGVAYTLEENQVIKTNLQDGSRMTVTPGIHGAFALSVDASESLLFFVEVDRGAVSTVDLGSGEIRQVAQLHPSESPIDLALSPTQGQQQAVNLYVVSLTGFLRKIEIATGAVAQTWDLPSFGLGCIVNDEETLAYVVSGNGEIYRLDLSSGQSTFFATTGFFGIRPMALSADETRLYVCSLGEILELDTETGALLRQAPLPTDMIDLALGVDGETLYAAGVSNVFIIDIPALTWSLAPTPPQGVNSVAVGRSGDLYATSFSKTYRYDPVTGTSEPLDRTIEMGGGDLEIDVASMTGYITSPEAGTIMSVDLLTGAPSTVASGLSVPKSLALSPDGETLLVIGGHDPGYVAEVDIATGVVTSLFSHSFSAWLIHAFLLAPDAAQAFAVTNVTTWPASKFGAFDLATGAFSSLLFADGVGNAGQWAVEDAALLPNTNEALIVRSGSPALARVDLTTGELTPVINSGFFARVIDVSPDGRWGIAGNVQRFNGSGIAPHIATIELSTGAATLLGETRWTDDLVYLNTADGPGAVATPVDMTTGLQNVTLTFDNALTPGDTTVASSTTGPEPPTGFQLADGNVGVYYEITTTTTFADQVEICVNYGSGSWVDENNLRLFHFKNGAWRDITDSIDTINRIICGRTNSFSPFAVFELQAGLDAIGLLELLVIDVADLNLANGINNSLDAKLNNAIDALSDANANNDGAALNAMQAFINAVVAQSGQAISAEEGNQLIATAEVIMNLLSH
jgi:sugar lactone lactonase YvrE